MSKIFIKLIRFYVFSVKYKQSDFFFIFFYISKTVQYLTHMFKNSYIFTANSNNASKSTVTKTN